MNRATDGMAEAKRALRRAMRARRDASSTDENHRADLVIAEQVLALRLEPRDRPIAIYMARPGEVDTRPMIDEWRSQGRSLALPAWHPDAATYRLAGFGPGTALRTGRLGIPEPAHPEAIGDAGCAAIIVPGLAFDRTGARLGQGGGHYDRMLAATRGLRIGVAFAWQLVDAVPATSRDIRVDLVVHDGGIVAPEDAASRRPPNLFPTNRTLNIHNGDVPAASSLERRN